MPRVLFTGRDALGPATGGPIEPVPAGVSGGPYARLNLGDGVGDARAAVAANRATVAAALGVPVAWMRQVHGARVVEVTSVPLDPVEDVDALVTKQPGIGLGVLVADCVPVVLSASSGVGVAHAGRRGLQAGVLPAVIDALARLGTAVGELDVWLGPAICGRCYEVPDDMQAQVEQAAPGSATTTARGTAGLDLRAGLVRQAREAGVRSVHCEATCTAESPHHFSYRRDGTTGRMAGLVRL